MAPRPFLVLSGLPASGKTTLGRGARRHPGTTGAVLCSFWRRPNLSRAAGTPTDWIGTLPHALVIEVLCECDPLVATLPPPFGVWVPTSRLRNWGVA